MKFKIVEILIVKFIIIVEVENCYGFLELKSYCNECASYCIPVKLRKQLKKIQAHVSLIQNFIKCLI